ncbi:MAG: PAS domain-containing sensor histidine kinase [Flavitalea sp.]
MSFEPEHISSLFENATEGFIITNSRGKVFLVNPAACRMFGYSTEALTGQPIEMLLPSAIREKHVGLRDGFYSHPTNRVMGHGRDLHGQKSSGEVFPVEVSLSTYLHNEERYVIAFIIDITTRKSIENNILSQQAQLEKLTAEMRELNTELEKKVEERTTILKEALQKLEQSQEDLHLALDKERQLNEIKSRFVSMASHEFRTPLSTVLSSASLAKKYIKEEEQDKRLRHLDKITGSVKHLNDLLEDFLSLGRLEEQKIAARIETFDVQELCLETITEMQSFAKPGQYIEHIHAGIEMINSDKHFLRNILINLLSNALKFSPADAMVAVASRTNNNLFTLNITDHGMGIPLHEQEHLFTSFFRAANVLNIQGTGLGLHIVKRYVDLLGGNIQLKSEEGKGTSITIQIPIHTDELFNTGN